MLGQTLGHYKILYKIGAGGMGEVYRAEDTTLDREVALKVLPPEVASDPDRLARFEREAKTLAALDHPNIVTIHTVEEADGVHFLTMACVEGRTLDQLIPPRGVSLERLLELAAPLADALRAAHERGIVHRDLKPGNVMVDGEDRLRVLDFGLAKLQPGAASSGMSQLPTQLMTQEGVVLGTYPYMSPEQAEGKTVDARSDLFSLGVILYEMATGKRPFRGETAAAVISSILKDTPAPVTEVKSGLPEQLGRIICHCLEKDPEGRFQSAKDVRNELEALKKEVESGTLAPSLPTVVARPAARWALAAASVVAVLALLVGFDVAGLRQRLVDGRAPPTIQSLAVLPFANLTGDPEQEYFVAGMHDALIGELAQIGALRVISRTSAMRYKDSGKSVPEIARELNVNGIVEASVMRAGDSVRIQVQLIEALPEERHLWAQAYDRDLRDVLAMHSDVARAIAQEIKVTLTPQEETRLASTRRVNPETYTAYLKGTFFLNQLTPEGIERGLALLREAVENDPGDPLAYAGLALGYSLLASHSPEPPPDAFARAKAAALKALELDETVAEAHGALAEIRLYGDWDWAGAEQAFRRALELNPSLAPAHAHYAWYLNLFGRQDEALAEMKRAQQVDPLDPLWTTWLGDLNYAVGQYDKAIEELNRALELDPDFPWAFRMLGLVYAEKGMYDEAIMAHEKAVAANPAWKWCLGKTYALAGRRDEARKIAAELKKEATPMNAWGLTHIYTALEEKDEALRWAEAAYKYRHPFTPWLKSPHFKLLHDDPRYQELRRRMNLPD